MLLGIRNSLIFLPFITDYQYYHQNFASGFNFQYYPGLPPNPLGVHTATATEYRPPQTSGLLQLSNNVGHNGVPTVVPPSASAIVPSSASAMVSSSAPAVVHSSAPAVVHSSAHAVVHSSAHAVVHSSAHAIEPPSAHAIEPPSASTVSPSAIGTVASSSVGTVAPSAVGTVALSSVGTAVPSARNVANSAAHSVAPSAVGTVALSSVGTVAPSARNVANSAAQTVAPSASPNIAHSPAPVHYPLSKAIQAGGNYEPNRNDYSPSTSSSESEGPGKLVRYRCLLMLQLDFFIHRQLCAGCVETSKRAAIKASFSKSPKWWSARRTASTLPNARQSTKQSE